MAKRRMYGAERVVVRIATRTVGDCFATVGMIKSARSGRILAETKEFPYGFTGAASVAAAEVCAIRGYTIHGEDGP